MIELLWNDPISEVKMAKYIAAIGLSAGQRVLDVGCGCGEVLIRMSEQYQICGTGVDNSTPHIAEANRRVHSRGAESELQFIEAEAQAFSVGADSLDLAICLGATHAFGLGRNAYQNAIKQMVPMLASGGLMLVGEGYMKQPAPAEYREFLGDEVDYEITHASNVETGKRLGLIPSAAWTSDEDEWDDFEWSYQQVIERKAEENPNDATIQERLTQRRKWMDMYLECGRDTLGFGVYLFRKP